MGYRDAVADTRGAEALPFHQGFQELLCINIDQSSRVFGKFNLRHLTLAAARLQVDDHTFWGERISAISIMSGPSRVSVSTVHFPGYIAVFMIFSSYVHRTIS